jgi:glycosyltransferase involved in cell wall biosynthesis
MKLLLSAYSCAPNRGSEPGVGWNWAIEIARLGHEVHVLTRTHNQASIEAELALNPGPTNLNFHYFDLKPILKLWKERPLGVYPYYHFWQFWAYLKARELHKHIQFDQAHHITFGTVRFPSYMGLLGIPFIFGPGGGGETTPIRLRKGFSFLNNIVDFIRDISNTWIKFDPLMNLTFKTATKILVKAKESKACIPKKFQNKVDLCLDSGIDAPQQYPDRPTHPHPKILFVGRLIYWKGLHIALSAFAKLLNRCPDARFTIIGNGQDQKRFHKLAEKLNISENIDWVEWVQFEELENIYLAHDLFLFPSLHDSGGTVISEAAAMGLPTICLDIGGPGAITSPECAVKIDPGNKSEDEVTTELSNVLAKYCFDKEALKGLSKSSHAWAKSQTWASRIKRVYTSA